MSAPALFKRIASQYDALWTDTPVGKAQRDSVWRVVDPLFQSGQSILDIGCGTGADAAHFVSRGIAVHAIDSSPDMIREASSRNGFTTQVLAAEELHKLYGPFDGAISNFGALNCVADPSGVAHDLGSLVRPGGRVAICVIGRFCAWETLYYAARFDLKRAFRRLRGRSGDIFYPTVAQLRSVFASHFKLERWTGIGMLTPPSYVKLPEGIVRGLAWWDRFPLLRAIADHRLLIFVRK
jgi:SAM-dependent methyltransferase